jgi:3-oxoacyl-[acyl-carrier-protein] synthase-3
VQTAAELSKLIGRSEEWILSRTHVAERRISDEPMNVMAAHAIRDALGDGPNPDLLINASLTPVQLVPDSSVFIQQSMAWQGLGIPSFSVHATCMSFLLGLHTAGAMLSSGAYKRIVVVSSEQGSVCRDFDHPESAALIGDGAAAAVVVPTPDGEGSEMLAWGQTSWPGGADLAELRGCGTRKHPNNPDTSPTDNLFRMRGPRIFKMAVTKVRELATQLVAEAGLTFEDIDVCVPHQASGPGLAAHSRFLDLPEHKIINVVGQYGNCIAASIPMALAHADAAGRLKRGDIVLLLGTGAGLHVAGMILRW